MLSPCGLWSCLFDDFKLMKIFNMSRVKNEWVKIVSHNYRSKVLPAMRDYATRALRGNLLTRSKLFKMKLVDNRLYLCPKSRAIWDMANMYLAEFRDWMSSNRDSQFSIDHSLYIAEKKSFSIICLTVPHGCDWYFLLKSNCSSHHKMNQVLISFNLN